MKITEYLAIYAAFLSTIVFIWNVTRSMPRVKVKIIYGTNEENLSGIYISIQNPSSYTVHLDNISILHPCKKRKFWDLIKFFFTYRHLLWHDGWVYSNLSNFKLEHGFPLSLDAGKSHNVFISEKVLETIFEDSERREIMAVVQDQLWRNKYSRKFKYEL
jgi:hypothetical protein